MRGTNDDCRVVFLMRRLEYLSGDVQFEDHNATACRKCRSSGFLHISCLSLDEKSVTVMLMVYVVKCKNASIYIHIIMSSKMLFSKVSKY